MTVYLLDVNLLLALSDPLHEHHEVAHRWFGERGQEAWATCPITENGFVRIASHPRYPNRPGDTAVVLSILQQFCAAEGHHFWAADVSLRDVLEPERVMAPAQVTDLYLLCLAVRHGGKLATLDRRIPGAAVRGAPQALEQIAT